LSPSKYSPQLFLHCSQRFFQFWKHSWNASFEILYSSASAFCLISSSYSNRHPFSMDFSLMRRKKSDGTRSGECGGWGTSVVLSFVKKITNQKGRMSRSLVMMEQPFFPSTKQPFFLLNACLTLFITFR
jgi:hypothetical protein